MSLKKNFFQLAVYTLGSIIFQKLQSVQKVTTKLIIEYAPSPPVLTYEEFN